MKAYQIWTERMQTDLAQEIAHDLHLRRVAEHQARLQSLWIEPRTINEALLQAALRHLHAIIEEDAEMAEFAKSGYWDVESEM